MTKKEAEQYYREVILPATQPSTGERRKSRVALVATFCPFCGKKYPQ